jgi:flagellin-like protein
VRARGRRSLSNLVGAVILIAATIVGGLFVYSYFQRSIGAFMSLGSTVSVVGTDEPINSTSSILYLKIVNNEQTAIQVTGIFLVNSTGKYNINLTQPLVIQPSSEASMVRVVPGTYSEVYVAYNAGGATYYTQPTSLG